MHQIAVLHPMFARELVCPTCAEIRSASCQVLTGVVQPTLLGFLATMALAHGKKSIAMPHPFFKFGDFCRFVLSISTPQFRTYLVIMAGLNTGAAMLVAHEEGKRLDMIMDKLNIHSKTQEMSSLEVVSE